MKSASRTTSLASKAGLDPAVRFGLIGVLVFFAMSGFVAYLNLQTLRDDNQKIIHSHDVIVALGNLLSDAQDAETGQRGFLLTGNDKYLEPYNTALAAISSEINNITRLTSDNPTQQTKVPALRFHIDAKLAELKETIDLRRSQGAAAALAVVGTDRGKVEMDAIRAQLTTMAQVELDLRDKRLTEMNDAYKTALVSGLLSGLLGIALTAIVGFLIRRATLARSREDWLRSGHVGLASATRGDQVTDQLGNNILAFLTEYLGAVAGALFVQDGNTYRRTSTYSVPANATVPDTFAVEEGLLGQAAAADRPVMIEDVPPGYLTFGSALGQDKPRSLVISPASVDGNVNTVLELGFLHELNEGALNLLQQLSSSIAIAVRSANYRGELKTLLEETQRKSEELQVQGEELRVSNEELEEQSRALREFRAAGTAASGARTNKFAARRTSSAVRIAARRDGASQRIRATQGTRTRAGQPIQIRLLGQHVPRAADASQFVAHPGEAAGGQSTRQSH